MANGHERPDDLPTATGSTFIAETSELAAIQSAKRNQVPSPKTRARQAQTAFQQACGASI